MYLHSHLIICLEIKTIMKPRRHEWTDRRSMLLGFFLHWAASNLQHCLEGKQMWMYGLRKKFWSAKRTVGVWSLVIHSIIHRMYVATWVENWTRFGLYLENWGVWALRWCMILYVHVDTCTVQVGANPHGSLSCPSPSLLVTLHSCNVYTYIHTYDDGYRGDG